MEEIINSVMQSPENTNPNVLRSQLQKIGGSSGDSAGWTKTETKVVLFEDTVTGEATPMEGAYAAPLDYPDLISSDSINVEYNGTAYTLEKRVVEEGDISMNLYGAEPGSTPGEIDFTNYPFSVESTDYNGSVSNFLITTTAGPNTIKVETISEIITPTDEFKAAVAASSTSAWIPGELGETDEQFNYTVVVDMTIEEILMAARAGALGVGWGGLGFSGMGIGRGIFIRASEGFVDMITYGGDPWQPAIYSGAEDAETGKTVFTIMTNPAS